MQKFIMDLSDTVQIRTLDELRAETRDCFEEVVRVNYWSNIDRELVGLKNFSAASDLLRYLVLYKYGGMYLDTDILLINDTLPQIQFYLKLMQPKKKEIIREFVQNNIWNELLNSEGNEEDARKKYTLEVVDKGIDDLLEILKNPDLEIAKEFSIFCNRKLKENNDISLESDTVKHLTKIENILLPHGFRFNNEGQSGIMVSLSQHPIIKNLMLNVARNYLKLEIENLDFQSKRFHDQSFKRLFITLDTSCLISSSSPIWRDNTTIVSPYKPFSLFTIKGFFRSLNMEKPNVDLCAKLMKKLINYLNLNYDCINRDERLTMVGEMLLIDKTDNTWFGQTNPSFVEE